MDIALPSDVAKQIRTCKQVLADLEADLARTASQEQLQQASPLEKAELHVTVAQAIQTLFSLYLRLHGVPPEEHPIAKEEDRILRFKRKVSKVHSENLLKNSRRATEVNIQAANRFISAAIPELSSQQKQALRQAGAKRKADPDMARGPQKKHDKDEALAFLEETMQGLSGGQA
ncbi:hypothetical protein ABBQ32_003860 [Trebouxia sp. C0010 RCD-2024]